MKEMSNGFKWMIILGLIAVHSATAAITDYPLLSGYVNDYEHLLTPTEQTQLHDKIADIKAKTTVEIAIVSIKDTGGEDRVTYANRLGEKAGVGSSETDNGVVIMWVTSTKQGAIATGRGIESTLNDAKVARIGRASRIYFDKNEYYNGYNYILDEISKEIGMNTTGNESALGKADGKSMPLLLVIIILISIVLFIAIVGAGLSGGGGGIGFVGSGGGWSGGSSSSGGFSGGSFGGGGGGF
jgi:uncharacterized protein